MATNINPNNGNYKNPKFVKNIVNSISNLNKELIGEYVPEAVKVYDSNRDFVKNIRKKKNAKISVNNVKDTVLFKSGKQLIENAVEDLKSGNFYNESRVNKTMQEAASSMFGIDFSFMDKLDSSLGGITNSTENETKKLDDNTISTTTTNKSTIVANNDMSAINMSFKKMAKTIMTNQNTAFGDLNLRLDALLEFKTGNTIAFYNNMGKQFVQIDNILNTFYRNMDNLNKIELGGLETTNNFNQLNSLLGSSELLTLSYYIDRLKPEGFDKSKLSPIMLGVKSALMMAMPAVLKDTLAETNTIIKNLPVILNQKFGDMRNSDNKISSLIGDTLYKDLKTGNSKYRIRNQAIGFDGVTRRAVVNVIPALISKIVNAMRKGSSNDELVYDYNSGGYRTKGDIIKASRMQFQQQIRGSAGSESDIEKYKSKVLAALANPEDPNKKATKKDRREVDKALYKMLNDKQLPTKGSTYSGNKRINETIIETFLNMDPIEKVDFVNAVTRLTTPQEWLEQNESFHNVFNPLEFDDIKKKYDRDYKDELYEYFKSKGMHKLAERVREGDAYERRENRLSKLNPFYYIVEGLRAGNDLMTKVLFSENGADIDKNSFIGKLSTKINYIMSKPLSEHVIDLKKKFKQRIINNPFVEEIRDAGLITGIKNLFKEASGYIKGEKLDSDNNIKKKGVIDKLKEDFVDPIIDIFKAAVTEPIKKQASQIGDFVKNVFTTITEPVKRVYDTYKNRYKELKGTVPENTYKKRAEFENKLKNNEVETSKAMVAEFNKNEASYDELNKSVSRGLLDMVKSIRTDLVNPVEKFSTSISLVMKEGDKFVREVDEFDLNLEFDKENYKANRMSTVDELSAMRIQNRLIEYEELITEVQGLINHIDQLSYNAKITEPGEELEEGEEFGDTMGDNADTSTIGKTINFLKSSKKKATNFIEKLEEKFGDKDAKTPIRDSFKKLGNKAGATITNVIGNMFKTIGKTSTTIGSIVDNVLKVGQNFFSDTLPRLVKSTGEELKKIGITALGELKNTGSDIWDELKSTGSKIWNTAKNVFSVIGDQILDFIGRVRQQEFDVYIEGGTLTGIRNTVYYIKPKQSGYEYMKNKFMKEDSDDSEDTNESDEYAEDSRNTIVGRIKERLAFIGDIVKSIASSALSVVTGGIKNLASSLLGSIGRTLISVIGPKVSSVIGKYISKAWTWTKGIFSKASTRTKKGKANLSKIMGKPGSAINDISGLLSDATPVYVVGGTLNGVGGNDSDIDIDRDSDIDDVIDDALDEADDKVSKEIAEEIAEETGEKVAKEIGEEVAENTGKKLTKEILEEAGTDKKTTSKILSWIGNSKFGKKIKSWFGKASDGTTWFSRIKKSLGVDKISKVVDKMTDLYDAGKNAVLSKLGLKGKNLSDFGNLFKKADAVNDAAKTVDTIGDVAKAADKAGDIAKAVDGGSSLLKLGKSAGKAIPILGTIAGLADIGVDFYNAFKADTWGGKISYGLSAILKIVCEVLDLFIGDIGIISLVGGLLIDWVRPKFANWIDKLIGKFTGKKTESEEGSIAEPIKDEEKTENKSTTVTKESSTKEIADNLVSSSLGKDVEGVASTLMSVTVPQTYLAYNTAKKYRDFKKQETETETKFLSKLSENERNEYLSNKHASVYASILRTQDGGKMVRTLMNTATVASVTGAGLTENDVLNLLNGSITEAVSESVKNSSNSTAEPGGGNGGSDGGSDGGSGGSTIDISGESDNATAVWKFFTGKGYSKHATAGIMGNLQQESSMDPTRKQSGGGPGRGIAQWTVNSGRYNGLVSHAKSKGKDWTDLQSQLEWIDLELGGKDSTTASILNKNYGGLSGFKKASDYKWAVQAFEKSFERAGKPNYANRYKYAESYFNKFSASNASYNIAGESEEGSIAKLDGSIMEDPLLASVDATTTGRFADSMTTSVSNLDTVSKNINIINNSTINTGITLQSPLDTAIDLLNNINKNVEESINKDTVIEEEKQESTKVNNSLNPFMDYTDTDLCLRSFSLDIKAILAGI